tara:strand:- start:1440 stop:3149 length:1710 start_codon:yes stop_codon:yes gene_type:complete
MTALWPLFITNVTAILLNEEPDSAGDFGNKLANEYVAAVKGLSTCVPGTAIHESSPGESTFISSYEQWLTDLFEKGEPVMETPDTEEKKIGIAAWLASSAGAASRLSIAGKDNDPEYNKLEGDIGGGIQYEPTEELDKYLEEFKDDNTEDLYRFKFFEFHRLDGKETGDQLARIFATRLLMQFEDIESGDKRYDFWVWLDKFKRNRHTGTSGNTTGSNNTQEIQQKKQNRTSAIAILKGLDWNWSSFANEVGSGTDTANRHGEFHKLVARYIEEEILKAHPLSEEGSEYVTAGTNKLSSWYEKAVKAESTYSVKYPWPFDNELPSNYEEMEPAEKLKVRYPFKLSKLKMQEPYDQNNKMPPVLTSNVITDFTWNGTDIYGFRKNRVKPELIDDELRKKWQGCPLTEADEDTGSIVDIDMSKTGTLAKQIRNTVIVELGLEAAMLAGGGSKDDPYKELAKATLKYWKDTAVQPFATSAPTPPCSSVPPLGGKYIGVSYGNQKKLADNLRRALNSGKDFGLDKAGAATAVAEALAYSYFTHLSEMKFIYLGGIPAGTVPYIPMIGFDATVI